MHFCNGGVVKCVDTMWRKISHLIGGLIKVTCYNYSLPVKSDFPIENVDDWSKNRHDRYDGCARGLFILCPAISLNFHIFTAKVITPFCFSCWLSIEVDSVVYSKNNVWTFAILWPFFDFQINLWIWERGNFCAGMSWTEQNLLNLIYNSMRCLCRRVWKIIVTCSRGSITMLIGPSQRGLMGRWLLLLTFHFKLRRKSLLRKQAC